MNIAITRPVPDPQFPTVSAIVRGLTTGGAAAFTKSIEAGSPAVDLPDIADGKGHPLPGTRGSSLLVTALEIKAGSDVSQQYPLYFSATYTLTPRPGYNRGGLKHEGATQIVPGSTNTDVKLTLPQSNFSDKYQYYRVSVPPQGTIQLSGSIENHFSSGDAILTVSVQNSSRVPVKQLVNNTTGKVLANSTTVLPSPPVVHTNNSSQTNDFFVVFQSNATSARISASAMTLTATTYSPPTCSCQGAFIGGTPPGWTGNRTYRIAETIVDSEQIADIKQAFNKWNTALLAASIPISFAFVGGAADISVVPNSLLTNGGSWTDSGTNSGNGALGIAPAHLGLNPVLSNLIEQVVLHEIGHALRHDDVKNPPFTSCTVRDTAMFDPIPLTGPFSGQVTCSDTQAVAGSR